MPAIEKVRITWEQCFGAVSVIETQIRAMSNNAPQSILAIGRGGFILGTMLSHKLDLPLAAVLTKGYDKNDKALPKVEVSNIIGDLVSSVLICDDVFDSGKTFKAVLQNDLRLSDPTTIVAVIATKQSGKYVKDFLKIEHFIAPIKVKPEKWCMFPWEVE